MKTLTGFRHEVGAELSCGAACSPVMHASPHAAVLCGITCQLLHDQDTAFHVLMAAIPRGP